MWQGRGVPDYPSRTLSVSGLYAEITPDRWVPGSFTLVVDGTPQSHVNLDDPSQLFFEYIQRMGHVIDQLRMPGEPITAVHLGAGALTLPRYVEATRPGSRQQVIELEPDLVDLVRTELPWSTRASIRVRHGDAREVRQVELQPIRVAREAHAQIHRVGEIVVARAFAHASTQL